LQGRWNCDEKSQCQALERTQRPLPLKKGYGRTQTHDYIRHGTITLFAALSYLEGKIISRTEESHTHLEWLRFLKQIDRETPKELDLHHIIDNYVTHKHPAVQHWLKAHGRFHIHFTPTSSLWLNLVERFFGELTSEVVREGSFQSLRELVRAIESYLAERNQNPKKYVWRATGLKILEKIQRAKQSIFPGWKFSAPDAVAAFGLHGALLIGPRHSIAAHAEDWSRTLATFEIDLKRDGTVVDHGRATNVLDGPVSALRHLVDILVRDQVNPSLAAGEIVTTGTLTRALPVSAGETWTTELTGVGLDGICVRFA
jgi:hypothetical protein